MSSITIAGIILGGLITLAGVAIFWDSWQQSDYQPVDGTVLESRIELKSESRPSTTNNWALVVRYQYQIRNETFENDKFSSSPPRSATQKSFFGLRMGPSDLPASAELQGLLQEFPVGAALKVHVSPSDPKQSVLRPPPGPQWTVLAIGLVILLTSIVAAARRLS